MDILFDSQREGIIHDRLDLGDIQSTRRDVSSDQERSLRRFEIVKRLHALRLTEVPVNSKSVEPTRSKRLRDAVAFFLVERKDQDSVGAGGVGFVSEFFESLDETAVFVSDVVKDFDDYKFGALAVCWCYERRVLTLFYATVGLKLVLPNCYADRIALECTS